MIKNFSDFCTELNKCGFSMGGGNNKGIYAIIPYDWTNQDTIDSPVKWHTGERETDPWEWRMRVLEERNDIAYGKLFFKASGYITDKWYPHFYAVRRAGESLMSAYEKGSISSDAKRIYDIICEGGVAALHEIKAFGGYGKDNKSAFDRAITELQMKMYITMCGRTQKKSRSGEPYGWNSTVFCTVEEFWRHRGLTLRDIDADKAYDEIREQILKLNPKAEEKKIKKFITG